MAIAELEHVASLSERILDEVERAVVGKRDALELVLARLPRRRPRPDRGLSRAWRRRCIARSFAQVDRPRASRRIQFTPDLMPSDVTGSSIFNQRSARLRVPAGPDLHEPAARRRDQPRPAEDAGGAARGDAGAAGHDRGRDAPLDAAVPRARDAEPDRVRGHVPAARGAARPLPAAHRRRLPDARATSGRCSSAGVERQADEIELEPVVDAPTLLAMQRGARARARLRARRLLHRRPRRGDARQPRASQVGASPRGVARAAQARRAPGRARRAATSSCPTT